MRHFRIIELCFGELEFSGLGKVTLAVAETEIKGRIHSVAELKLPPEIEEKLLARRYGGLRGYCGIPAHQRRWARAQAERAANEDAESATPEQRRSRRESTGMKLPFRMKY